jgi:iron complex outermembrane recepter protein
MKMLMASVHTFSKMSAFYPSIIIMAHHAFTLKVLTLAILASNLSQTAFADETTESTIQLMPIVTTATRTEQNSFDLPVAIDVVSKEDIQDGQLQFQLSESLIRVPGVSAQDRTNQAQDPKISSRGFGARASFGVRGIRLYVDGIPLTMPDGQGQPGVVDLSSIKSVEVMRGPFSALYGNSSGGVIQLFSEDAPEAAEVGATVMYGSYDTKRQILKAAGTTENLEYFLSTSNLETDGYRDHDSGQKEAVTAKFKVNISDATKLTTLVNWFDQKAQDPLGLTRAEAFSNPKSAAPSAITSNTRVYRKHTQVGFNLNHVFNDANAINVMTYVGNRDNEQYLALTSTPPLNANGRASIISRDFWGTDIRWDNKGMLSTLPYNISFGLNYGKMIDARTDINADNGVQRIIGTPFSLNRDEDNIATNSDQYIQGKLSVTDSIDLHAGARHSKVKMKVEDKLITGASPDNSGSVEYQKTTPVIGVVWKVNPAVNLYANYGRGYETPTFFELAYNSTATSAIPNLGLKPSESENYEIGAKAFISNSTQVNLNLFRITTKDEIVIADFLGGRSVFANANDTKRTGAELSIESEFDNNISTYFSYSLLNAKYDSSFNGFYGLVDEGNKIPGTYKTQLYGEIAWKYTPLGFSTAFEGRHNSKVYVNDQNDDTAPSYTIFNLRAGFEQNMKNWNFKEYLRVENMFDKEYIGSVRIGDSSGRFFETASDRNYLLGLSAKYKF